jgi:uncharacterized membrane protein YfcA
MNKRTLVAILGIMVAVIPLLGLPGVWKKQIFVVLGIMIAYLALSRTKKIVVETQTEEHEAAPMELYTEPEVVVPKPRVRRKASVVSESIGSM